MTHLLVAITPHGFGHAAQLTPVINALRQRLPDLALTLVTTLPETFLRERIEGDFHYIKRAADFGLVMHSALVIDLDASAERYAQLHNNWDANVNAEARFLEEQQVDLVLADVPYLTLAAAEQAGIPAFALCSLNWADIYRHYFSGRREAVCVLDQMETAYASAQIFFCPEPSMPMTFLDNTQSVDPIARPGRDCRRQLRERLGLKADIALVLIAPGGVDARFPVESWPTGQGVHWLISDSWQVEHPDVSPLSQTGLMFTDLLTSSDGVLGKCGYGTVTECVVNRTPLLYIPRPDWPEERSLLDWLERHQAAVRVEPEQLKSGQLSKSVERALGLEVAAGVSNGAEQVAEALAGFINKGKSTCRMTTVMQCVIYKSFRQFDYYLFVNKDEGLERVPGTLKTLLGNLEEVTEVELHAQRKLAQADVIEVMAQIEAEGYFLQMPPRHGLTPKIS